jgi:hypothetical protein
MSRAASQAARSGALVAAKRAAAGYREPMRRPHALHPPAFLIDQHGRVGAADNGAEIVGERAQLRPVDHVALEEDQSPRLRVAEERAVFRAEARPGAAKDSGADHARLDAPRRPNEINPWR